MAATFSYAQAAKGMSTTATPATQSKAPSGATTPALTTEPTGINWADEGEAVNRVLENGTDGMAKTDEAATNGVVSPAQKQGMAAQQPGESGISSPSVAASSSSTATKEDDASSVPNASSESTWDNKSQTSNSAERAGDQAEAGSEKKSGKDKKKEKEKEKIPPKPLQEAPIPTVNVWKQRAEANASKVKPTTPTTVTKPAAAKPAQAPAAKSGDSAKANVGKKGKDIGAEENDGAKATGGKARDEDQSGRRAQGDTPRGRRGPQNASSQTLPPVKDQESWPTPEDVQGEDRRKAQEKTEKSDKDRPVVAPKGKNEWVSMPYTPTVVFNTPMPNTGARRGGRGGGRGGAQVGGRPNPSGANGTAGGEKDTASTTGDQPRRGRTDAASQEAPPAKAKRTSSAGSAAAPTGEKTEAGAQAARSSNGDAASGAISAPTNAQRNTAPRQKANRKFDQAGADRRKDDGSVSPSDTTGNARRGSAAVQQPEGEQGRRRSFSQGDGPAPTRSGGSERRSGQYGSVSGRERENRGRGNMRGGRNSNHGYQNGHHGNFPNGHASFSLPRSPPGYEHQAFFGQGPQQQRGYRGGRSQSLQTDSLYGRPHPGYAGSQPLAPLQTYGVPYDYMQPMTAMPYNPYMDPFNLLRTVTMQMEYYFSVDNLCKDMFLRKHMDSQGFVFLDFIAGFNRVKALTTDISYIRYACTQSTTIDFKVGADGKDRLRRREGWEQWVLTTSERDASAQNDGPEELHPPNVPPPPPFDPRFMMQYPGSPTDMPTSPSHTGAFQPLNGIAQGGSPVNGGPAGSDLPNGGSYPEGGVSQFSSMNVGAVPAFAPNPSPNGVNPEADSFSDAQTKGLTVIVRKREQAAEKQPAFASEESRTFSNGSIDSRSIADEVQKSDAQQTAPQTNGHGPVEANEARKSDILARALSPSSSPSSNSSMRLFWVKDQESPVQSESLPSDANVVLYTDLYRSALDQREAVPVGNCPYDMDVLYQFWSHFLIRNFNTGMYDEFRRLAFEDSVQRSSDVGIKCLIKYYGEALSSQSDIRVRVARHYVDLVKNESLGQDSRAFRQFRLAWRSSDLNVGNRKKISAFVDDDLKTSLEQ